MTVRTELQETPVPVDPAVPARRWAAVSAGNLVVVLVLSVASWWLLADPETSPWHFYPLPFNAALFWAILFVVFAGFNLEFAGFTRLRQPLRGLAIIAATVVFALLVTWALAAGLGRVDPDFAAGRAGGLGYFAGALFVLFAFFTYVMAVLNWGHWPWVTLGLRQPLVGFCEIAFLAVPTILLFAVFGLPSISAATPPGTSLMTLDTVLGFFYSLIVATLLTGAMMDNWPWRLAGPGWRTALAATVGNIVLGAVLYVVLLAISKVLLGSAAVDALGGVVHQFPAQLGVCWAFWMIMWQNGFGNRGLGRSPAAVVTTRVVITFALGIGSFLGYYYGFADRVLHEPVVVGALHGNALGFFDWLVLWTLFYVVALESYGLVRRPSGTTTSDAATSGTATSGTATSGTATSGARPPDA
jgi:AAT family amino acid transporter